MANTKYIDGTGMIKKLINLIKSHSNLIHFAGLKMVGEFFVFLFPIIIAKYVKPEEYGAYSLGMMIVFFSTTLLLGSSMTPFIIAANKELKKYNSISKSVTNQLIFFAISLFSIGILFLLLSNLIIDFIKIDKILLGFLYLAFVGVSIKSLLGNYFLGVDKKNEHVKISILYGISMIILLFILGFSLERIFLNYFLTSIIILFISLKNINFKEILPLEFEKSMFKEQWDFTKWQMMGLTAVYFINWGDTIIINFFLTLRDVGIYNLAYQVFKGIISLLYIINTFYLPEISKNINDRNYIEKYLFKSRIQLVGMLTIFTIIMIILSPFLLEFFDESYAEAGLILQILLFGVIFKFWSIFYNPLYNVLKRYRYLQIMNIIQIIINIALGVALILIWGIVGVAIATTISYLLRLLIDEIYFHKKVKKSLL